MSKAFFLASFKKGVRTRGAPLKHFKHWRQIALTGTENIWLKLVSERSCWRSLGTKRKLTAEVDRGKRRNLNRPPADNCIFFVVCDKICSHS